MKSAPLFNAKTVNINVSIFGGSAPGTCLTELGPASLGLRCQPIDGSIPELGAVWPGQGGLNGGLVAARGEVPAHYLIIAAQDAGSHEWGGRGRESQAASKWDGLANTVTLMEGDHPAAKAATAYSADGHDNFYLPAAAELYHCWLNVPDLFAKDTWYWSSTQRSAYDAFYMYFGDGSQYNLDKLNELRVRPVRRLFI
ncbi:DUF1566 domain-containing protein [Pseudomonas lundensis]|uniref:DUF1566 domain-containing protein n=1 Tax=Pseudomonas lundensis TaxID=86185 RepID=UPI0021CCA982|nr:DUF1566 domain-containing protein [Pseudomonas lundensis]